MDEATWLTCVDPTPMLEFLRGKVSDRKLWLVACACCRGIWSKLVDSRRRVVEAAERYADRLTTRRELRAVARAAMRRYRVDADPALRAGSASLGELARAAKDAASVASFNRLFEKHESDADSLPLDQANCLRDIIGNPYRPVVLDPAWRTPTVTALARAAYEERELPAGTLDVARLAILADALEDAGCGDEQILDHLRGPGPHVRGCFVLDALLSKE